MKKVNGIGSTRTSKTPRGIAVDSCTPIRVWAGRKQQLSTVALSETKLTEAQKNNLLQWQAARARGKVMPHKTFTVEKWKLWLARQNVEAGKARGEIALDLQQQHLRDGINEFRTLIAAKGRKV